MRSLRRHLVPVFAFLLGFFLCFLSKKSEKTEDERQVECVPCVQTHQCPLPKSVTFSNEAWVMDCITWERRWEVSVVESKPFKVDRSLGRGEQHEMRLGTFKEIFARKDWPAHDPLYSGLQVSGPGAQIRHAQGVTAALHSVISRLKIILGKSKIHLLDLPCGDLQWMQHFLKYRDDVIYTGVDIVPELIENHRYHFSRFPNAEFIQWDIVKAPIRNKTFDLILCRDMLQHLWRVDAMQALKHLSSSGADFLLATNFLSVTENVEVEKDALGGRKSSYNLELPPFLLESPICTSYDWNVEHLSLWRLPLMQKVNID